MCKDSMVGLEGINLFQDQTLNLKRLGKMLSEVDFDGSGRAKTKDMEKVINSIVGPACNAWEIDVINKYTPAYKILDCFGLRAKHEDLGTDIIDGIVENGKNLTVNCSPDDEEKDNFLSLYLLAMSAMMQARRPHGKYVYSDKLVGILNNEEKIAKNFAEMVMITRSKYEQTRDRANHPHKTIAELREELSKAWGVSTLEAVSVMTRYE